MSDKVNVPALRRTCERGSDFMRTEWGMAIADPDDLSALLDAVEALRELHRVVSPSTWEQANDALSRFSFEEEA